jgi:hypothetical protein
MLTIQCDACGKELVVGEWPFCPHGPGSSNVIGDDIPGGVLIKHGVCNEDGTPKRYYTKSSIKKAAYEKGLFQGDDTPRASSQHREKEAARAEARGR